MPIKGLTESRRLPRLGKIHLGIKKTNSNGKEYPSATDFFVLPEELRELFGNKPTELPILFPVEDEEQFTSQFFRSYSMSRGLVCKGDGVTSSRMVDTLTGAMANRDTKEIAWQTELKCEGKECPYYGKLCKEVMNLQFILPTAPGLGVWQIDTGSINSIININSMIALIRGIYGRIAMVPLLLTLEPIEVKHPDTGKKKTVRVLNHRTQGTMLQLMEAVEKPRSFVMLPAPAEDGSPEDTELPVPDDEIPELIIPQNQEPEPPVEDVLQTEPVTEQVDQPTEPASPELDFDKDWLKESLKKVNWKEATVKSYLKNVFKVDTAGTVIEVVARLEREQREAFFKEIQDRLQMM